MCPSPPCHDRLLPNCPEVVLASGTWSWDGISPSVLGMPTLNAIGIVASDMARSIRFYRLLGLAVPETPDEGHVDAFLPSGVRFMLDSEETGKSFRPDWERAIRCAWKQKWFSTGMISMKRLRY